MSLEKKRPSVRESQVHLHVTSCSSSSSHTKLKISTSKSAEIKMLKPHFSPRPSRKWYVKIMVRNGTSNGFFFVAMCISTFLLLLFVCSIRHGRIASESIETTKIKPSSSFFFFFFFFVFASSSSSSYTSDVKQNVRSMNRKMRRVESS